MCHEEGIVEIIIIIENIYSLLPKQRCYYKHLLRIIAIELYVYIHVHIMTFNKYNSYMYVVLSV